MPRPCRRLTRSGHSRLSAPDFRLGQSVTRASLTFPRTAIYATRLSAFENVV
jgi:hypothetical protein